MGRTEGMEVLRKDTTRTVLTAEKGGPCSFGIKKIMIRRQKKLLSQTTYNKINNDPTTKYKNRLINLLKSIKSTGGITEALV